MYNFTTQTRVFLPRLKNIFFLILISKLKKVVFLLYIIFFLSYEKSICTEGKLFSVTIIIKKRLDAQGI